MSNDYLMMIHDETNADTSRMIIRAFTRVHPIGDVGMLRAYFPGHDLAINRDGPPQGCVFERYGYAWVMPQDDCPQPLLSELAEIIPNVSGVAHYRVFPQGKGATKTSMRDSSRAAELMVEIAEKAKATRYFFSKWRVPKPKGAAA